MGMWNETCALTSLPITEGERVRVFIVISLGFNSDEYSPCFGPITGTYNCYGTIDNIIENEYTHYLCNLFKDMHSRGVLTIHDGCNFYSDITSEININNILCCIERGILLAWDSHSLERSFDLVFVIDEFYELAIKNFKQCETKSIRELEINLSHGKSVNWPYRTHRYDFAFDPTTLSDLKYEHSLEDRVNAYVFNTVMRNLRREWRPFKSFRGAQDAEFKLFVGINDAVSKYCQKRS